MVTPGPVAPATDAPKDGDKAEQWYAAVGNDPANTQRTLKVFAICE